MKTTVGSPNTAMHAQTEAPSGMVWIPGGTFVMGSDHHYPEEAPAHEATVKGFWMDSYTVTNTQFRHFVEETQYLTLAERAPNPQDYPQADPALLVPGSAVFRQPARRVDLRNPGNWWEYTPGANWQHPEGPASSLEGRWNYPVTHVAYEDALAYATWAGKHLPTEAQWERAARGGLEAAVYAWGNEFTPGGKRMANTWQGEFPWQNRRADAQVGPLPVGSFPPNGYGLYDMIGNVWEWTTDWYQAHHAARSGCCHPVDPLEQSLDPVSSQPRKVLKGGSFLCAPNYCQRYRPAARIPETLDTSTCHLGFRCVIVPG
jgi:formylglycine-generating enzyme